MMSLPQNIEVLLSVMGEKKNTTFLLGLLYGCSSSTFSFYSIEKLKTEDVQRSLKPG
jgi:hypothetical protein